jgi:hypothetical protein
MMSAMRLSSACRRRFTSAAAAASARSRTVDEAEKVHSHFPFLLYCFYPNIFMA